MKLGLQLPSFTWPGGAAAIRNRLRDIAETAEEAGYSSLWVMDHFFQLPPQTGWDGPDKPMLEAYTTLGYLAAVTDRIQLGAMVTGVSYRPPGLLIKALTTLDVLAGGRAYFGIGAGWYEHEARNLGLPFPPRSERFEQLEETLRIARQLFDGERQPFHGKHYQLEGPFLNPMPLSQPRPRILIGGSGERKTLRLVAQYADACNILVPDPGESRAKLAVLRQHCEAVGRDYAEVEKTSLIEVDLRRGSSAVLDQVRAQVEEGIEHVIVNMPNAHELGPVAELAMLVVPALAEL